MRLNSIASEEFSPALGASCAVASAVRVMHLVDSLAMGGAERVAVNLANLLSRREYCTYLCTTRNDGPLAGLVAPHVKRLRLERTSTWDVAALRLLVAFIKAHQIQILHAHGTALFVARLAGLFCSVPVIWHDHYGRSDLNDRPVWLYRTAVRNIAAIITVNQTLADWSRQRLRVARHRVRYIPNLVDFPDTELPVPSLSGVRDKRIVCVANFRPQKDHPTLLHAMVLIRNQVPTAHLLLIGGSDTASYINDLRRQISELGLTDHVSYLGQRQDVPAILRACDIGVLSSISEGLPLALLEYGAAGLAVVVTNVGQCAEVIGNGTAGILVPPSNPEKLAQALLSLLSSGEYRLTLGREFRKRTQTFYSSGPIIGQISDVYRDVLQ